VVGAAGSGTTLMRLILDSHENIAIAQETGFARALLANEWVPFWQFGGEWYDRVGLSRDDLEKRLADFYGGIFADFAAQRGASRWGDKTPFHLWHLELLTRVFPDAVVVATVRHPGAVAHSTRRRMGHAWQASVRYWLRDTTELLIQGAALGDRFALCRYEDLVNRPEPLLRELVGWLGEPWSDRLLVFHEVHRGRGTEVEVEGATRSDRPLDPSRADAWTATMDEDRWRHLRRGRVGKLSRFLGYAPRKPLPKRGWGRAADGLLLDGTGLRELMSRRRGLDWDRRPSPSFVNRPLTVADLQRLKTRSTGQGGRSAALARVEDRAGNLGRQVLRRLPPDARAQVRSLAHRTRR